MPALIRWHEHHRDARAALRTVGAVPAHVLLECYSVLTRLPAPHRLAPQVVADLLDRLPGPALALPAELYLGTVRSLATAGIKGGATYDGLVGATAAAHERELVTLDRRALSTYEAIGAVAHLL